MFELKSCKNGNPNQDFTRKLPDDLIVHILSHLSLKDAVRTCILSKRWKSIWRLIPNPSFALRSQVDVDFLDRALPLWESSLKEFSLFCGTKIDASYFSRWITAAVTYNVEVLNIRFDYPLPSFQFPPCFLLSKSITKLDICSSCRGGTAIFSASICLSNLKNLGLAMITFLDDDATKNLFSGCPLIETMRLFHCNWINVTTVRICSPKLWKLEISESRRVKHSCDVEINGSCLKYFGYQGFFLNQYCLYDVASIEEGNIDFFITHRFDKLPTILFSRSYMLLRGLADVKNLLLSSDFIKVLNRQLELLCHVPLFTNLSVLTYGGFSQNLDCRLLLMILQKSPCLETLRFPKGFSFSWQCKRERVPGTVHLKLTTGILICLKQIEIVFNSWFGDRNTLLDAIAIVLKGATSLDTLIMDLRGAPFYFTHSNPIDKEELMKAIIKLPRASKFCKIDFLQSHLKFI